MNARRRLLVLIAVVLALAGSACGGGKSKSASSASTPPPTPSTAPTTTTAPLPPDTSFVATAKGPTVDVFDAPDAPAPSQTLDNPNENGAPLTFLLTDPYTGTPWIHAYLPVRPNGSTGWIKSADVTVTRHAYRIKVALAEHLLTLTKEAQVVEQDPIGVGTQDTPTPGGVFYIKELLQPPNPNGPYGPYAYGLSGFSNVLTEFGGGEGVIGIHGTNDPSSIGQDQSHGCIRMNNDAITHLAQILPLGTPVEILP